MNNLSYSDIEPIVEELIKIKSRLWKKSFLAAEDIAQEMRLKCISAIKSYDPTKGKSIKTYLNVCTENFLKNLMRDTFAVFNPPCKKTCDHYDMFGNATKDANNCPVFITYLQSYNKKIGITSPLQRKALTEEEETPDKSDLSKMSRLNHEIEEILVNELSFSHPDILIYYSRLVSGFKIPKSIRSKIRFVVANLMQEANHE